MLNSGFDLYCRSAFFPGLKGGNRDKAVIDKVACDRQL